MSNIKSTFNQLDGDGDNASAKNANAPSPLATHRTVKETEDFLEMLERRQAELIARMSQTQVVMNSLRSSLKDGVDIAAMMQSKVEPSLKCDDKKEITSEVPITSEEIYLPATEIGKEVRINSQLAEHHSNLLWNDVGVTPSKYNLSSPADSDETPQMVDKSTSVAELMSFLSLSQDNTPVPTSNKKHSSANFIQDTQKITRDEGITQAGTEKLQAASISPDALNQKALSTSLRNGRRKDKIRDVYFNEKSTSGKILTPQEPSDLEDVIDMFARCVIMGHLDQQGEKTLVDFANKIIFKLNKKISISGTTQNPRGIINSNDFALSNDDEREDSSTPPTRRNIRRRISGNEAFDDAGNMGDIDTDNVTGNDRSSSSKTKKMSIDTFARWKMFDESKSVNVLDPVNRPHTPVLSDASFNDAGEDGDVDTDVGNSFLANRTNRKVVAISQQHIPMSSLADM